MIQVVGAGLGRTGTTSLKAALEQLLGGPCYHMFEVFGHPEHPSQWSAAYRGDPVEWPALFDGYTAVVDWPAAGVWRQLAAAYPDAPVILSTRRDADTWWKSASETIFVALGGGPPPDLDDWFEMAMAMMASFTPDWREADAAKAAYEAHNAAVRAEVPSDRLVEWQPDDGWEPLCAALGLPVPDEPFPHSNTTEEFRAHFGLHH